MMIHIQISQHRKERLVTWFIAATVGIVIWWMSSLMGMELLYVSNGGFVSWRFTVIYFLLKAAQKSMKELPTKPIDFTRELTRG